MRFLGLLISDIASGKPGTLDLGISNKKTIEL